MKHFANVLITGASSGIGAALARACAGPGVTLHLAGRDAARLDAVAASCRDRDAVVHPRIIDVRDAAAVAAWIGGAGRLDLVVANAGVSAATGRLPEPAAQVRAVLAVNLDGAINTILPALAVMAAQAPGADGVRGRIAAVASVAAFLPLAEGPAYCASKAALDAWVVATAPAASRQGVRLTSVCPGYVQTPMTAANRFPMPGVMDADRAAAIALRGIAAGRVRVAFPWWIAAAARLAAWLPPAWLAGRLRIAPEKLP